MHAAQQQAIHCICKINDELAWEDRGVNYATVTLYSATLTAVFCGIYIPVSPYTCYKDTFWIVINTATIDILFCLICIFIQCGNKYDIATAYQPTIQSHAFGILHRSYIYTPFCTRTSFHIHTTACIYPYTCLSIQTLYSAFEHFLHAFVQFTHVNLTEFQRLSVTTPFYFLTFIYCFVHSNTFLRSYTFELIHLSTYSYIFLSALIHTLFHIYIHTVQYIFIHFSIYLHTLSNTYSYTFQYISILLNIFIHFSIYIYSYTFLHSFTSILIHNYPHSYTFDTSQSLYISYINISIPFYSPQSS